MRSLVTILAFLISTNSMARIVDNDNSIPSELTPEGIQWALAEGNNANNDMRLTLNRYCRPTKKSDSLFFYRVDCSSPKVFFSEGIASNIVFLSIEGKTVFKEDNTKNSLAGYFKPLFSNDYISWAGTGRQLLDAANIGKDVAVHVVWKDGPKNRNEKTFQIAAADVNEYLKITSKSAEEQVKRDNTQNAIFIITFLAAGIAIAILIYRRLKIAYSKSKDIYAKKKDDFDKKRVARLVEDEALKVQVRKEMQSAPTTTESVLKEQINEALSRGDSKLATELLELFKLSQENK